MSYLKLSVILIVVLLIVSSCSFVDKLKKQFSSKDKEGNETTEEIKETTSSTDLEFYNKYIDALNKLQAAGDKIYESYLTDIGDPKAVTKSSLITGVFLKTSVTQLENAVKEQRRSFYDGGELSKLKAANKEMQKEVEESFKNLLKATEQLHETAKPVVEYYADGKFKEDLSKVETYDKQMKEADEKYREAFRNFNSTLKKYKPKRQSLDVENIKDPDKKAVATLLNSYQNTLETMEELYEKLESYNYDSKNQSEILAIIDELEKGFEKEKTTIQSTNFSDRTKIFKYNFEDGLSGAVSNFIKETRKFMNDHKDGKISKSDFGYNFNTVVNYYNSFISIYNSHINALNTAFSSM
ncbi:MAG: YiiG family protein [Ignavibacteria bacterium]|nr:YiiG family protein [Ignavibacteria bacterium]